MVQVSVAACIRRALATSFSGRIVLFTTPRPSFAPWRPRPAPLRMGVPSVAQCSYAPKSYLLPLSSCRHDTGTDATSPTPHPTASSPGCARLLQHRNMTMIQRSSKLRVPGSSVDSGSEGTQPGSPARPGSPSLRRAAVFSKSVSMVERNDSDSSAGAEHPGATAERSAGSAPQRFGSSYRIRVPTDANASSPLGSPKMSPARISAPHTPATGSSMNSPGRPTPNLGKSGMGGAGAGSIKLPTLLVRCGAIARGRAHVAMSRAAPCTQVLTACDAMHVVRTTAPTEARLVLPGRCCGAIITCARAATEAWRSVLMRPLPRYSYLNGQLGVFLPWAPPGPGPAGCLLRYMNDACRCRCCEWCCREVARATAFFLVSAAQRLAVAARIRAACTPARA